MQAGTMQTAYQLTQLLLATVVILIHVNLVTRGKSANLRHQKPSTAHVHHFRLGSSCVHYPLTTEILVWHCASKLGQPRHQQFLLAIYP